MIINNVEIPQYVWWMLYYFLTSIIIMRYIVKLAICLYRCRDYVQVSGEFGILFDACGAGPPSSSYIVPAGTV